MTDKILKQRTPVRIRTKINGDIAEIFVQFTHPMESGSRLNPTTGNSIPANFIQTIRLTLNKKIIIESQLGPTLSRNPQFSFKVKGINPGDNLSLQWTDSSGKQYHEEKTVKNAPHA